MAERSVRVQLFGAFRRFVPQGALDVVLNDAATVRDARAAVSSSLARVSGDFEPELLAHSVFAAGDRMLTEDDVIGGAAELAVLPPVCGG